MNIFSFEVLDEFVGLTIFLLLVIIYSISLLILKRRSYFEKYNLSLMGPALMWRTHRGINFLRMISGKKRFWTGFGSIGIVICFIVMVLMVGLIVWQTWFILGFTQEQKELIPGPEFILAIPGINPVMPLDFIVYILIAFIVAIIVHEFSHGILTFTSELKVKSLGVLYLIVPIGAFCEPDEKQLTSTKVSNRMRIFSAGPTANFVAVLITIFILSFVLMNSVQPAANGISVLSVFDESPAEEIGLQPGMIITDINNTNISTSLDFRNALKNTSSNQTVNITYYKGNILFKKQVKLTDQYKYYKNSTYMGLGELGITPTDYHKIFLVILKNPFVVFPDGFLFFWMIPFVGYFQGYNPIVSPFIDSYIITGPLSIIPQEIFWMIINTLYWIFWLNFAVAIFNVIPIIPLDGGYLFKDGLGVFVRKINRNLSEEEQKKRVESITIILSFLLLFLILFPFVFKYI